MGKLEYKYLFETDVIRNALLIYIRIFPTLSLNENSKEENSKGSYSINNADIRYIKKHMEDFKILGFKLLDKEQNFSYDTYINTIHALIIINLEIQSILQKKIYRRNKEVGKLLYVYEKVNKLLNAESALRLFLRTHKTFITILSVLIIVSSIFAILFFFNKDIALFFSLGVFIVSIIFILKLDHIYDLIDRDKKKRMLSNLIYPKSQKIQKLYSTAGEILSQINPNKQ